jgi:hypothetical protein
MPHATTSPITVHKLEPHAGSSYDVGAEIRGANLEHITGQYASYKFLETI